MIVSSDLIARDPRVSSRFNFSEKKNAFTPFLSPRWPSDYAIESRVHGDGSGSALVLGFDSRRRPWLTDPF